eukprot:CAMPEP_0113956162 /NCGR_PEP_ID=MMETSP0011_2-20120614/1876_1 /TAXON_ID=101924 /ORGANISM="Rhodosorus marinus" /LENGTH=109 /DNA_ID=CAMNT_0000966213 /DNA_START=239 /DNA_END=568 /DNA_ORIENTATION=- /assembly_acc=CAM_ASM_000156
MGSLHATTYENARLLWVPLGLEFRDPPARIVVVFVNPWFVFPIAFDGRINSERVVIACGQNGLAIFRDYAVAHSSAMAERREGTLPVHLPQVKDRDCAVVTRGHKSIRF